MMIKRAILVFLIVFAVYNVGLHLANPSIFIPQNIKQDNTIKVQEYLYSDQNKDKVVLGSSVSAKLDKNILAENNIYNLGFRGQSVYDGLNIIKKSNIIPKVIFVEINVLNRPASAILDDMWFYPAMIGAKKALPALKERNQPVNTVMLVVQSLLQGRKQAANNDTETPVEQPITENKTTQTGDNAQENFEDKYVKGVIAEYQKTPKDSLMTILMTDLKTHITDLEAKNVKVVFFEMPMHSEICKSPAINYLRDLVKKNFPESKYQYLPMVNCNDYQTRDAIHLTNESATKYTKFFAGEVNKVQ
jgi:hypothetical protein